MKKIIVISLIMIFSSFSFIGAGEPDPIKLVREVEDRLNFTSDLSASIQLIQKDPEKSSSAFKLKYYRRDKDDKFVLLFQEPETEKGKGYLRLGDDLFMYLPSTREFVHKNRKESVGDTDAKADNFEMKKYEDLYNIEYIGEETVANRFECWVVKLTAKEKDVSYPIQKMYIRKDILVPVMQISYSWSETKMQTQYFISYEKIGNDKYINTKSKIIDNLEKGKSTLLMVSNVSTDEIPNSYFTKKFLEQNSN